MKGYWNLGSCDLGSPTNGKQSMLVATIPAALERGARLLVETRAQRFDIANKRVPGLVCQSFKQNKALAQSSQALSAIKIIAKHYVLSGGAVNSPAVLLRSQAPDPHGQLGKRTFCTPS